MNYCELPATASSDVVATDVAPDLGVVATDLGVVGPPPEPPTIVTSVPPHMPLTTLCISDELSIP